MCVKEELVPNAKKIAILRANALGDFIVTLPAIAALRRAYPGAELVLLGKDWHREFVVEGRTPIDRVIVVPVKKGIRAEPGREEDEAEVQRFVKRMQAEAFDIVISMQGNGTSTTPFIRQFGAAVTVGMACRQSEKPDRWIDYYYYQSEELRFLELAKLIGAPVTDLEPKIRPVLQDVFEASPLLDALQGKKYAVLHPVATDVRRMWPLENFPAVANELKRRGYEVVFSGSKHDSKVIRELAAGVNGGAYNSCGLSLGALTALLKKSSLLIGADTGPMHLGRALQIPTIGFYWAPNLINWGPLTRKQHHPLVSWKMECPLCGTIPNDPYPFEPATANCVHEVSFVRDITVAQVIEAVDRLLPAKEQTLQREAIAGQQS